jgi:uncharacterized protein YbjQ (UPF0145 family)
MNWVVSCTGCGSSYVYESGQGLPDICPACSEKRKKEVKKFLEKEQKRKEILAIHASNFADRKIVRTLGIVTHEHVFGVGLVQDLDLKRFNGGVSISWSEKVKEGRDLCIRSIEDETIEMGGNGVIGVEVDYRVLGTHNDMVMWLVAARGTAVTID